MKTVWAVLDFLAAMGLIIGVGAGVFMLVVGIGSNIAYSIQYQDLRIERLEAGQDPPDFYAEFCTQPRDRSQRKSLWFLLPRCYNGEEAP